MTPTQKRDLECEIYLIDALMQIGDGVSVSDLKPRLNSKQVKEIIRQVKAEVRQVKPEKLKHEQRPMLP